MKTAIEFLEDEIGECHDNPNIDNEIMAEVLRKYAQLACREQRKMCSDFVMRNGMMIEFKGKEGIKTIVNAPEPELL